MRIHPVGAELFYADRRTDGHDEANSFSQFCEDAKVGGTKHAYSIVHFRASPEQMLVSVNDQG